MDMNEPGGNNSQNDIIESIDALLRENAYVNYIEFERVLEDGEEDIPIKHMDEILRFISNQTGLWHAKYFFSPGQSTDVNAKQEMDGWDLMWQGCSNAFADILPDGMDLITRRHDMVVLQLSMESRVEFYENRPLERFATAALAKSAHWVNKLGFSNLAGTLMNASMFPKGTVGRSSE